MQNGGLVNRLSNVESKMLEQDARLLEHDHKFDTIFETMDRGELQSKGLYYNNQMFDAYVFVCGLIRQAKRRIVLVDRYVDEKVLAMMLKRGEGVSATIYTYDKRISRIGRKYEGKIGGTTTFVFAYGMSAEKMDVDT